MGANVAAPARVVRQAGAESMRMARALGVLMQVLGVGAALGLLFLPGKLAWPLCCVTFLAFG